MAPPGFVTRSRAALLGDETFAGRPRWARLNPVSGSPAMFERFFSQAANKVSDWAGSPGGFSLALGAMIVWAALGPLVGYSEVWQLAVNTGTTIVTFLMVFIIQNSQNRDTRALQIKMDELIRQPAVPVIRSSTSRRCPQAR